MKLLFDQNLSHHLVRRLSDIFPECEHVRNIGLNRAADSFVWSFAKNNGFLLVSKDADFHQRSLLFGHPPKVFWVKLGNCSTRAVEQLLRDHMEDVVRFEADETATFLILSRPTPSVEEFES